MLIVVVCCCRFLIVVGRCCLLLVVVLCCCSLGGLVPRAFSLKNTRVRGGGSCVANKSTVKMKAKHILHKKTQDFSAVGGSDM